MGNSSTQAHPLDAFSFLCIQPLKKQIPFAVLLLTLFNHFTFFFAKQFGHPIGNFDFFRFQKPSSDTVNRVQAMPCVFSADPVALLVKNASALVIVYRDSCTDALCKSLEYRFIGFGVGDCNS